MRKLLYLLLLSPLFFVSAARAQDTCPSTAVAFGITGVHCWFYSQSGANTNLGTKASPWKDVRGMISCTSGAACSHTPVAGEGFIFKGGDVWDKTNFPLDWIWHGTASTSTDGCTGSGCIYIGYDPTWNDGIVNSVVANQDYGGCPSVTTVALSGGGGISAAATATMVGNASAFGDGGWYIGYYTMTNQGSAYTSNPTATITGVGCRKAVAIADIFRPVFDFGGQTWNSTNLPTSALVWADNNQANFTIWDNLEMKNAIFDNATASTKSVWQNDNNNNVTITHAYVHNWGLLTRNTGGGDGAEYAIRMNSNNGTTSHMLVDNVRVNNGEQVINCTIGTPTQCSAGNVAGGTGRISNSRLSFYPWNISGTTFINNNDSWGVSASDNGGHTNVYYEAQGTPAQYYIYNNFYHDNDQGAFSQITQGVSTTWWIFNNVCWYAGSGGTFVIDTHTTSTGSSTINFINNTCNTRTDYLYNNGNGASNIAGLNVNLYNMDAITDQTTNLWWFSTGGQVPNTINGISSPTNTTPNPFNYVPTQATALATNYTTTNAYQPTSSSSPTVTFSGTNFTSSCTGVLVPLCADINGVARPATGPWQAGAYFFGGGSPAAGTPTCSPTGGTFSVTQNPNCSVAGGAPVICYTTNGTTPATNGTSGCTTGTLYTGAIAISVTTTLKLIAGGTSFTDGPVQSYTYTINPVTTAPAAATFALNVLPLPLAPPIPIISSVSPASTYRGPLGFSQDGKTWATTLQLTLKGSNMTAFCQWANQPLNCTCNSPSLCFETLSMALVPLPSVATVMSGTMSPPVATTPVLN